MNQNSRFTLFYALMAILGVVLIHDMWVQGRSTAVIPYSEFQKLVRDGKVEEVVIGKTDIQGKRKTPAQGETEFFVTTRVDDGLAKELGAAGIKFAGREESTFLPALLSWVLPVLLFFGIWYLLQRRMSGKMGTGGGMLSIGKSNAKVYVEKDTKTSFKDVAGVEESKAELEEIVSFLKDPASYGRLGARMPKGVLLVGPPGTGKTLLARAVAGEAGVPFYSISGSEFVEMFVGVGAARVRDLFEQARKTAPCIIFIDELDAMGRTRNAGPLSGGNDEKEQTLNQLLVELDGFDASTGIVLLGATNRPEVLDPALLRAGRFDRQVVVDRPDRVGRAQIVRVHMRKVKASESVQPEAVAALTPGFTGADLANLVNEAALAATRRKAQAIETLDFNVALERMIAGLEKRNRLLNPKERRVVAFHELGHALVAAALPGCDPVHKISIIPRSIGALGYTIQRPTDDRFLMTRDELQNKMMVFMGGRAAEQLIFGHLSTGAADDLNKATEIARNMITRYAMLPERLGPVTYDTEPAGYLGMGMQRRLYSEDTAEKIDGAIRELVGEAFDSALSLLRQNQALLEAGAEILLEKESLEGADLDALLSQVLPKRSSLLTKALEGGESPAVSAEGAGARAEASL